MLQKLKRYSAKKKIGSFLEEHQPIAVKQLQNIGVIFDLSLGDDTLNIGELASMLKVNPEGIQFITFSDTKAELIDRHTPTFNPKDLTWKGNFREGSEADNFRKGKYNLLINYFTEAKEELIVLSSSVRADFKVGFPLSEERLNDLEISVSPDKVEDFINELNKYLSIINQ